jgi:hypothetical protein
MKLSTIAGWPVLVCLALLLTFLPGSAVYAQLRDNEAERSGQNFLLLPLGNINLPTLSEIDEDDLEDLAEEQVEESMAAPVSASATITAGNVSMPSITRAI